MHYLANLEQKSVENAADTALSCTVVNDGHGWPNAAVPWRARSGHQVLPRGLGAVAVSAREQLWRVVRLSPAEINAEAANQRESLTGARVGNAQIYDYLDI